MKMFSRLRCAYVFIPFLVVSSMQISSVSAFKSYKDKISWDHTCESTIKIQLPKIFAAHFASSEVMDACQNIMSNVRPLLKEARPTYSYHGGISWFKSAVNTIVDELRNHESRIQITDKKSYDIVKQWHEFLNGALRRAFFHNVRVQHEQFNTYLNAIQTKIQAYDVRIQYRTVCESVATINGYLGAINALSKSDPTKLNKDQYHYLSKFPAKQKYFNDDINTLVNIESQFEEFKKCGEDYRNKLVRLSQELRSEIETLFSGTIELPEQATPAVENLTKLLQGLEGDSLVVCITNEFKKRIAPLTSEKKSIESLSTGTVAAAVNDAGFFITSVVEALLNNKSTMDENKKKDCLSAVVCCAKELQTIDSTFKRYHDGLVYTMNQLIYCIAEVSVTEKPYVSFAIPKEPMIEVEAPVIEKPELKVETPVIDEPIVTIDTAKEPEVQIIVETPTFHEPVIKEAVPSTFDKQDEISKNFEKYAQEYVNKKSSWLKFW